MFCNRKKKQQAKDDDLKALAANCTPILSTDFVRTPPAYKDRKTFIYIWGQRSMIHEDAILDPHSLQTSAGASIFEGEAEDDTETILSSSYNDISAEISRLSPQTPSQKHAQQQQQQLLKKPVNKNGSFDGIDKLRNNKKTDETGNRHKHLTTTQQQQQQQQSGTDTNTAANANETNKSHRKQHLDTLPLTIKSLSSVKITSVVCGDTHLLFLGSQGTVYAYGVGRSGQLGLGYHRLFVRVPEIITALSSTCVIQVAAGKQHSVVLSEDGNVYIWGAAEAVGDACGIDRHIPQHLPKDHFLGNVKLIAAGYNQTMAVSETKQLYVWGDTFFNLYYAVPHKYNLFTPEDIDITHISIGKNFALALSDRGHVFAWGDGTYSELGRLKSGTSGDTKMRATIPSEVLLTDSSGTVLPKIVGIATGERHSLLLGEDGNVFAFGENLCGQCGAPTTMIRVAVPRAVKIQTGDVRLAARYVTAGNRHSGVITRNNQLVLWGHSAYHKLIHTAPSVHLLEENFGIGPGHMGVAIKSGWKDCCHRPKLIYSLLHEKVACICLGNEFTVVVTGEGMPEMMNITHHPKQFDALPNRQVYSGVKQLANIELEKTSINDEIPKIKLNEDDSEKTPYKSDKDTTNCVDEERLNRSNKDDEEDFKETESLHLDEIQQERKSNGHLI